MVSTVNGCERNVVLNIVVMRLVGDRRDVIPVVDLLTIPRDSSIRSMRRVRSERMSSSAS